MRGFLDPVASVAIRKDLRNFVKRANIHPTNIGTAICANTGKTGPRNSAYSIDYGCPTIVSGDITIHDTRPGVDCFRKLNLTEKANMLSKSSYSYSDCVPMCKHEGFLARSMDGAHLDSWIVDAKDYLMQVEEDKCVHLNSIPAFMSNSQLHKGMGHLGRQKSAAMGIPHPKYCGICELGNRKKAGTSKGVKGRSSIYGHSQHIDFKISFIPGTKKAVALMCATDDANNEVEVYPMKKRREVNHFMRQLKVDIRDKGGCFSHIITDNDSVLISQAFREFLLEDPKQLLSMELCPPYHISS